MSQFSRIATVGGFRTAIYSAPIGELDGCDSALAAEYIEEGLAAPIRAEALRLWGEQPLEFLDSRPSFRGSTKRKEIGRLSAAVLPRLRRAAFAKASRAAGTFFHVDLPSRRSAIDLPQVDRIVIADPLQLAATWREALALIELWRTEGNLQELYCTACGGGWLVREGAPSSGSIPDSFRLAAEHEAGKHADLALVARLRREGERGRGEGGRRRGRPKLEVDEGTLRQCRALGASDCSIIRGVCGAAEVEGRSISASTVRSRLKALSHAS